jgi:hypothetical protein
MTRFANPASLALRTAVRSAVTAHATVWAESPRSSIALLYRWTRSFPGPWSWSIRYRSAASAESASRYRPNASNALR